MISEQQIRDMDPWEIVEKICGSDDDIKFSIDRNYTFQGRYNAGFSAGLGYYGHSSADASDAIRTAALYLIARLRGGSGE